jgi:hypothetical protein
MALPSHISSPSYCIIHDGIINMDRKQHEAFVSLFLLESRLDFFLYPMTIN